MLFRDRHDAGRMLASQLRNREFENPIVIALPRGGIPIGLEVARVIHAAFDILVVRKIGLPSQPEFGIGALAEGGEMYLDPATLSQVVITATELEHAIEVETRELERRVHQYRHGTPMSTLQDRTVILVDDGLATGVTVRAATRQCRKLGARQVVVAVPVCSPRTVPELRHEVDEVICVNRPHLFHSVGQFYLDFPQMTDEQVLSSLKLIRHSDAV